MPCNGTLPANATTTNGTTYTQTRNGSQYVPNISYNTGSGICGYSCNAGYTRDGLACVQNSTMTYSRWTGDWGTCDTTPTPVSYSRQPTAWMCLANTQTIGVCGTATTSATSYSSAPPTSQLCGPHNTATNVLWDDDGKRHWSCTPTVAG